MKRILAITLAVLMVLGMTACGNSSGNANNGASSGQNGSSGDAGGGTGASPGSQTSGEKQHLVLMMYTSTAIQEEFEQLLIPFEEENNVDVDVILVSLEDYDTKLSTMIGSGASPDVMLVAEYQKDQYISEGLLLDISEFTTYADYDYEDFVEVERNYWTADGKVYGIPCSGAPLVCFYNKDLFEQANLETPTELYRKGEWTVDAMIDSAKAISALGNDIYGITFSRSGDWANWDVVLTPVLRLYGGDAWNDEDHSEILINSAKSIKGLELLDELMETGVHPLAGTTIDFLAGQLGMWPDLYGSIKKMRDLPFEWDVVPMPVNEDGKSIGWMGPAAWGVIADTSNPELAKACVEYLTTGESLAAEQFTFIPTRESVLMSDVYTTGNFGEVPRSSNEEAHGWIIDSLLSMRIKQSHENYQELSQAILEGLDLMYAGNLSPAEAANYMAEEMAPYMLAK